MKFGRTYVMTIQSNVFVQNMQNVGGNLVPVSASGQTTQPGNVAVSPFVQVAYPLTLDMDIKRDNLASTNHGHFTIYNLSPETRKQIYHDQYDTLNYKQIAVYAGYNPSTSFVPTPQNLPKIFQGNIFWAYNYRRGPDWITEIDAFDGLYGVTNSQVNANFPKNWTLEQMIKVTMESMKSNNINPGAIGNVGTVQNTRGVVKSSNSYDILQDLADETNECFIDNEVVNVIGKNDYIDPPGALKVISSDTGLLESPRRYGAVLQVKMIFEPRLAIKQKVSLQSIYEPTNNNDYAVIGIEHRGTISGGVAGDLATYTTLWEGTSVLSKVAA